MTNVVKIMCKEAFDTFDIVRIFAEPYAHNMDSRRVLEKSGFKLEGIMKNGGTYLRLLYVCTFERRL